jgi:transposase
MVHLDLAKWGQSPKDLRELASTAAHARSRERYLGLYMIASGQTNATQWASEIGRTIDTVLRWVHRYNRGGVQAVEYRRSGGRPPFLAKNRLPRSPKP